MDISALMSGFFPVRRDLRRKHAMGQMRGAGRLHFVEYRARDARRELGDNRGCCRIVHDSKLRGGGVGLHMHIDRDGDVPIIVETEEAALLALSL